MKKSISDRLWVYPGSVDWDPIRRETELFIKFHTYSDLIDIALFEIPFQWWENRIIHTDTKGRVFLSIKWFKQELFGDDKLMALIAMWKQKKTMSRTKQHERKLWNSWVIQKSAELMNDFSEKLKSHWYRQEWAAHSWWNHLIPLYFAYKHIRKTKYFYKVDKEIRLWIVFTYAALNNIPSWLFLESPEDSDIDFPDWFNIIYTQFHCFEVEKFWSRMSTYWYDRIARELFDNFIPFASRAIESIINRQDPTLKWWLYLDVVSQESVKATNEMFRAIERAIRILDWESPQ